MIACVKERQIVKKWQTDSSGWLFLPLSVSPELKIKDEASKAYLTRYGLGVQKIQPVTNIGIENLKIYRVDSSKSSDYQFRGYKDTSFSIEAHGKRVLVDNSPVPYESAAWVPHAWNRLYGESGLKDISYFHPARPYFLSPEYTWPSIGPELEKPALKSEFDREVSQTIPAKGRYDAGAETYISKITGVAP